MPPWNGQGSISFCCGFYLSKLNLTKIKPKTIGSNGKAQNKEFSVQVKDDAIFTEALAMVDKYIFENPEESHFVDHPPNSFVRCYLQLFWDPIDDEIYSDINVFAASARGVMPIQKRMDFNLYDDCEISLTSSA